MDVRVYIGNLNRTTTQAEINTLFTQAGVVSSVELVTDEGTGLSKGFAYVSMPTQADADKAIRMFHDSLLGNSLLKVNMAQRYTDPATTMKAMQIHSYGEAAMFVHEDTTRPKAGAGEVLIHIHATTVNRFDCAVRAGYLTGYYPYAFPLILGLDVSGVVEEVGSSVTDFAVGDAVFARADPAKNGAYAEYIALPASEVAFKPASLDHQQAAALPHVGLTAWRAMIETANLTPGQTVLIHAAAGGVGSIAVQLAKWRGVKVIGTASGHNLDFIRDLGVDEAIDYTITPFEKVARDVDVVLDTIGGNTQERSWQVLKPGGILIGIVQPPSQEVAATHRVRQQFVTGSAPAGVVLSEIAALVKSGHVKPVVSSVHPLQDIQKAHELVEGAHNRGKLVLQVINKHPLHKPAEIDIP